LWPVASWQLKFCSCFGTVHFNFAPLALALDLARRVCILAGAPQSENACGFLRRFFEMILEIFTVLFLVQSVSILSRLVGHRRDVLYYVSKPDLRW
jgi:hypothetical protein